MARDVPSPNDRRVQANGLTARQEFVIDLLRDHMRLDGDVAVVPFGRIVRGVHLAAACRYFRERHQEGTLPAAVGSRLEGIPGWRWRPQHELEERRVGLLRRFVAKNGWGSFTGTTTIDGERIGSWITQTRWNYRRGRVRSELRNSLESIPGWTWRKTRKESAASYSQRKLKMHVADVTAFLRSGTGKRLTKNTVFRGKALRDAKKYLQERYKQGLLPRDVVQHLESLRGWVWSRHEDTREKNLERLRGLAKRHGGLPHLTGDMKINGYLIGPWLSARWQEYRERTISPELKAKLEAIPGWQWKPSRDDDYRRGLAVLRKFLKKHELSELRQRPVFEGYKIKNWVQGRRRAYVVGKKMPEWLVEELESIPEWSWTPRKDRGDERMKRWRSPRREHR